MEELEDAGLTGPDRLIGNVIANRYRIQREIGRGGMGVVYLAEHVILEKQVALKLLLTEHSTTQESIDRFLQEAKAASRIGHENIVDVVDFGTMPDRSPYFVMEYIDGRDLSEVLLASGPFPWERACHVARQVSSALAAAHEKKIVHRDLKPGNILLHERGERKDIVKIVDFGIARIFKDQNAARLTRAGTVLGTPAYMAPEQARELAADHRVDVYSLGCILYEMLTGTVPFDAPTAMEVFSKHIFDAPETFEVRSPFRGIPAAVEAVVMRAIAKLPEERFAEMKEMGAALDACLDAEFESSEVTEIQRHETTQSPSSDHFARALAAFARGDNTGAYDSAERGMDAAPDSEAPEVTVNAHLLIRIYESLLGDGNQHVRIAVAATDIDPRAAFLISRIEGDMTLDDLLDVSGMPRLESTRIVIGLVKRGVLVTEVR